MFIDKYLTDKVDKLWLETAPKKALFLGLLFNEEIGK